MLEIPQKGRPRDEVLEQLTALGEADVDWHAGRVWSLVYHASDEHKEFLQRAHGAFASANLLNPMAFKSLKRMETEVVRMTASMLHGPADAVGTMTSGGTESILLAVKAARDRARKKRWWVRNPELVAPTTIHPAFHKAAEYFGLKLRRVPVDGSFRVDLDELRRAVGRNTVLIAASAPQYAHGMVDPIEEIGSFAAERGLPFHVDACFGGFTLPWFEALGEPIPRFDFRVDGVTSMSADIHKYGYAAKGASVVVYRSMDYLRHQFHVDTESPLGIYASPTILGTRPGGPIAAAWATLMSLGREGYLDLTRKTIDAKTRLRAGLEKIEGLEILGSLHGPVVTWRSNDPAVTTYAVADQLAARGWGVDRQQSPDSVHCTVTANHGAVVDDYVADIAAGFDAVRKNPDLNREGEAAMYGMMTRIPIRGAVRLGVMKVLESMYAPDAGSPDLGNIGEDEEGLLGLMGKYQDRAIDVLDRVDEARDRVKSWLDQ